MSEYALCEKGDAQTLVRAKAFIPVVVRGRFSPKFHFFVWKKVPPGLASAASGFSKRMAGERPSGGTRTALGRPSGGTAPEGVKSRLGFPWLRLKIPHVTEDYHMPFTHGHGQLGKAAEMFWTKFNVNCRNRANSEDFSLSSSTFNCKRST